MQFVCDVLRQPDGRWTMRYSDPGLGRVAVTAASRAEAAERMQKELRYRLEICPCTGETYSGTAIEVVERPAAEGSGRVE
jgi:hypothetical protein